jgi:8-oxo-dGTP pyrophosphatase MutT (NUDIX family)
MREAAEHQPIQSPPSAVARRGVVAVIVRNHRRGGSLETPREAHESSDPTKANMLVIRRSQHVVAPGMYCFPGGGIEPGENEQEAVVRELREELNVPCTPKRRLWECVTPWNVWLAWWLCDMPDTAMPVANPEEVDSIHWFTPTEMANLPELLVSNRHFLEKIASGEISLAACPTE